MYNCSKKTLGGIWYDGIDEQMEWLVPLESQNIVCLYDKMEQEWNWMKNYNVRYLSPWTYLTY